MLNKTKSFAKTYGFTLIELLVVISVIGLLSTVVMVSMNSAREKARIARAVADIKQIEKAVHLYYDTTGIYPQTCNRTCTQASDPFLNSLGVSGWTGPYTHLWNQRHPWGGHLNYYFESRGPIISFDDDSPGAGGEDNSGPIPASSILRIDEIMDNGNTSTGKIRVNLDPECNAAGEFCYFVQGF